MTPAEGRQRGVGHRHTLRDKLLVDADQIAAAAIDPLKDLIAVRLRFLSAVNPWHRGAAGLEDRPDRAPGDLKNK